jgi:hypothetical protein
VLAALSTDVALFASLISYGNVSGSRYSDGLQAGRPRFNSQQCKIFISSTAFQTDSGAHPASYPMNMGGCFPKE